MTREEIKDNVETLFESCIRDLRIVQPIAFVVKGRDLMVVGLRGCMEDENYKIEAFKFVNSVAKEKEADAMCLIAEGWVATLTLEDLLCEVPRNEKDTLKVRLQPPHKEEVLMANLHWPDGTVDMLMAKKIWKEGKWVMEPAKWMPSSIASHMASRFVTAWKK